MKPIQQPFKRRETNKLRSFAIIKRIIRRKSNLLKCHLLASLMFVCKTNPIACEYYRISVKELEGKNQTCCHLIQQGLFFMRNKKYHNTIQYLLELDLCMQVTEYRHREQWSSPSTTTPSRQEQDLLHWFPIENKPARTTFLITERTQLVERQHGNIVNKQRWTVRSVVGRWKFLTREVALNILN